MINKKFNKKKTNPYSIVRLVVFIIFIIILFFVLYEIYKSNTIKKIFVRNIEKFSQHYEYSFTNFKINKLINIKIEEIEKYFRKYYGKSIFFIPINEISKDLFQNKWIEDFTIKNDYKNTININIIEKKPVGIYFNDINYFLFDKNGEIIDSVNLDFNLYSHLIIFEGNNSLFNANYFLNSTPLLFLKQIKKAFFIGNRRWNIKLKNGIYLKLAEKNILDSLNNYDKFYNNFSNQDLREIEMIDLRISEQIILKFKKIKND